MLQRSVGSGSCFLIELASYTAKILRASPNLKTTNNIPIKSSPFSILIEKKFDFENKSLITYLTNKSGIISLRITNSGNKKSEGLILEFSEKPFSLKKWLIKDTFGEITTVLIQKAKYNNKLSHLLFFPDNFPEPNNSD